MMIPLPIPPEPLHYPLPPAPPENFGDPRHALPSMHMHNHSADNPAHIHHELSNNI